MRSVIEQICPSFSFSFLHVKCHLRLKERLRGSGGAMRRRRKSARRAWRIWSRRAGSAPSRPGGRVRAGRPPRRGELATRGQPSQLRSQQFLGRRFSQLGPKRRTDLLAAVRIRRGPTSKARLSQLVGELPRQRHSRLRRRPLGREASAAGAPSRGAPPFSSPTAEGRRGTPTRRPRTR